MNCIDYREIWQNINCLVPVYDVNGGNFTEIRLDDGMALIDNRKTINCFKNLARIFAADIPAAKDIYFNLTQRKNSIPLPFHSRLVLIPLKFREPLAKNDGAWGYVVLAKVASYEQHPEVKGVVRIFFMDGGSIDVLHQMASVRAIVDDANRISKAFNELHLTDMKRQSTLREEPLVYVLFPCEQIKRH